MSARLAVALGRGGEAPGRLLKAAELLKPLDPTRAREIYSETLYAALYAGRLAANTEVRDAAAAALASPVGDPPSGMALFTMGLGLLISDGYAAAVPMLRRSVEAVRASEEPSPEDLRWHVQCAQAAPLLWDDAGWMEIAELQLRRIRAVGATELLPAVLNARAAAHILAGEFPAARSLVREIEAVSEASGLPHTPYAAVAVAAYGPEGEAFRLIDANLRIAKDRGEGLLITFTQIARSVLCNALGRYEDAFAAAASAHEDPLLSRSYILEELIESAARSGRSNEVVAELADLSERAAVAKTDWARGVETRSRALMCDDEAADALYQASIAHLERTRARVQLARSHLVYGEWLRREGRRIDARQQLRTAWEMLDALGAVAFTERAARELAATGETVRRRPLDMGPPTALTARESQIALLAADGLSNRDIGEQLFISHRTVGYHLGRVFSKLGVNNRAQLHNALDTANTS